MMVLAVIIIGAEEYIVSMVPRVMAEYAIVLKVIMGSAVSSRLVHNESVTKLHSLDRFPAL